MKINNLLLLSSLIFVVLSSCKDNEREAENVVIPDEKVEQSLDEMRDADEVVAKVSANPELSTFATGLDAWNVEDSLETAQQPVVVFAPTNMAYSKIYQEHGQEVVSSDSDRVIAYHVVKSGLEAGDLKQKIRNANGNLLVETMQGEEIKLGVQNGQVTLTGGNESTARITDSIQATDGTIYIIDGVLLPDVIETEVTVTAEK